VKNYTAMTSGLLVTLMATLVMASPLNFKITGMHCGACVSTVEKTVCKDAGFAKCKANLLDASTQSGELIIETKPGQKADPAKIIEELGKLGYKTELKASLKAKGS